tara:strand:+ start:251 stop:589 length:339 start_codon:yes stop_codon:yes gene_type:complete
MNDIYFIAYFILIIGIISDLLPKINKIFKIYTTEPLLVNEYSKDTIIVNIYKNICFLFYMIINNLYILIIYSSLILVFNVSILYIKYKSEIIKRSSSQTNLVEMSDIEMSDS